MINDMSTIHRPARDMTGMLKGTLISVGDYVRVFPSLPGKHDGNYIAQVREIKLNADNSVESVGVIEPRRGHHRFFGPNRIVKTRKPSKPSLT